jgi:hypothetical protein
MTKPANQTITGYPVKGFPIKYKWQTGLWEKIFDLQVELIHDDILRARAEDKLVIYLSCPISGRGGGYHGTNVEIARRTERRLLSDWGERFWILNPCQYQMESKEGAGLIVRHAERLKISKASLDALPRPGGGDYMRMWMRVLVEDANIDAGVMSPLGNTGRNFDAFYFLGPGDVREFFTAGGAGTLTACIEEYFARKFTNDPDFCDFYSVRGIEWGKAGAGAPTPDPAAEKQQAELKARWETARKNFFRFYAVRASANFSLGCHDEWNTFRLLNEKRRKASADPDSGAPHGDHGELLPGFFDGKQISPGAAECAVSAGYAV